MEGDNYGSYVLASVQLFRHRDLSRTNILAKLFKAVPRIWVTASYVITPGAEAGHVPFEFFLFWSAALIVGQDQSSASSPRH